MQKIRKILRTVSEKTVTNQPTNQRITKNTVFLEPDWRRSKKQQKKQNL